jgi:ankyrin repeat protein
VPTTPEDALRVTAAVRSGDYETLRCLVESNREVATSHLGGIARGRTALHVVADWPGYFPDGPRIAQLFIDAGADVNDRGLDGDGESPLHWTASSDDADVAAVLIDAGADIEMPDGSIGTPLDNAIGYGCWHVARLLLSRGARVEKLWHAGALGLLDRLDSLLGAEVAPSSEEISPAFWHACDGGQRRAAELLLQHGADLEWSPDYAEGAALDAARRPGTRESNVVEWLETQGARKNPLREESRDRFSRTDRSRRLFGT